MTTFGIIMGIIIVIVIVVFVFLFRNARKANLTGNAEEKPAWMRETPPAETLDALAKEGKKVSVFYYEDGEKIAAPFSEQIEDIFKAKVAADPNLKHYKVDLGTAGDGTLELWIDEKKYTKLDDLPEEGLKKAFRDSVTQWNK